jgi:ATP-dependent RNA helicase DDX35
LNQDSAVVAVLRRRNTVEMPPMQFWKPGAAAPGQSHLSLPYPAEADATNTGSSLDRENEAEGSILPSASSSRLQHLSLEAQRQRLPIYKHREKLLWCVEKYQVVIVVGQTGCGKSTRTSGSLPRMKSDDAEIPQYLHEAGWSSQNLVVACTQPRRVAATSVATRVAEEVGSVLGDEVGVPLYVSRRANHCRLDIRYVLRIYHRQRERGSST